MYTPCTLNADTTCSSSTTTVVQYYYSSTIATTATKDLKHIFLQKPSYSPFYPKFQCHGKGGR